MNEFEQELSVLGFNLLEYIQDNCTCPMRQTICIITYIQQDCESIENDKNIEPRLGRHLPWWRFIGCEKCTSDFMSILGCGGHWNNTCSYYLVPKNKVYEDLARPLDPNEILWTYIPQEKLIQRRHPI